MSIGTVNVEKMKGHGGSVYVITVLAQRRRSRAIPFENAERAFFSRLVQPNEENWKKQLISSEAQADLKQR